MDKSDKVRLLKLHDELLDNLVFDVLSPALLQNKLIDVEEYEKISGHLTNKEKVTTFLKLLPTKGPDAFINFIKVLQEDYDWISAQLRQTIVNQTDLNSFLAQDVGVKEKLKLESSSSNCERPQDTASYTSEESIKNVEHVLSSSVSSNGSISPRQVSEFSRRFSQSPSLAGSDVSRTSDDVTRTSDDVRTGSELLLRRKRELDSAEISEEMIQFVSENPRIMRRWQSLAHQAGMSARVPIIQARIRMDGRDHDEHIVEFIREWTERMPGEATVSGLVKLLRSQKFNDSAEKIEDGSFLKKMKTA